MIRVLIWPGSGEKFHLTVFSNVFFVDRLKERENAHEGPILMTLSKPKAPPPNTVPVGVLTHGFEGKQ
jgi:hypothetical protein